ncbi:MAG TPA: hypothetical protein VJQ61_13705 [Sinomonas sp.]|nr:hypothetical protein [Sinomonas sp.]
MSLITAPKQAGAGTEITPEALADYVFPQGSVRSGVSAGVGVA